MKFLNLQTERNVEREKFYVARKFFKESGVIKSSSHGLRSGDQDDYYFDIDYQLNDPYKCGIILNIYTDMLNDIRSTEQIDLLGFIEKASGGTVGAIRLASSISIDSGLPNIVIRPKKGIAFDKIKVPFIEKGESGVLSGLKGRKIAIITDHCSYGEEALICANILKKNKAVVNNIITYTCRKDKFDKNKNKYDEANIKLTYAFDLPSKDILYFNNEIVTDKIAINY